MIYCCCLVTKVCPTLETPWTVAHQIPSAHGISQARILEWVAITFCRGSSWPRNQTHICISKQVLYHWATREAPLWCVCVYVCLCVFVNVYCIGKKENGWSRRILVMPREYENKSIWDFMHLKARTWETLRYCAAGLLSLYWEQNRGSTEQVKTSIFYKSPWLVQVYSS